jgi:hypothetical protein
VEGEGVTGLATEKNRISWLILREDLHPVPDNFNFQFEFTPLQGADHNLVWNFIDDKNYYQAHLNGGAIWVTRFINGQGILSVAKNFPTTLGQTYALEFKQQGSQVTILIEGEPVIDFVDWTSNEQSRGQVGFKLAPGSVIPVESRFTNISVTDPNLTSLPVELIKQTDPAWSGLIYDTANLWSSQPTMGRWGCAVTSLTMIMRSYGLSTMPDGAPTTPAALNAWLITQPDGYVGQGLVNWFAATRLIAQISDQYSTTAKPLPKLEFAYQSTAWPARLQSAIANHQPAIVQVPGHFVVAHGFDQLTKDFLIRDPFYDFTHLSSHPPALSLRLFTPSQTDLSAIVVIHRPSVRVEIRNTAGDNLTQTWTEWLDSDPLGEQTESWQFSVVNQPADDTYQLSLDGAQADGDVQILIYNREAEAQNLTPLKNETNDFAQLNLELQFSKTSGGTLIDQFSWEAFLTQLSSLHHDQLIDQPIFIRLQTLVKQAKQADQTTWSRYKNYLKNILELVKNQSNLVEIQFLQHLLD